MSTPAGWYDDPENAGQQRYFDGQAWTDQRQPAAPPGPPSPPAPTAPPVASSHTATMAPVKQRHTLRNVLIALAVVLVLMGGCTIALVAAGGKAVNDAIEDIDKRNLQPKTGGSENPTATEETEEEMTASQENALESAESYLDFSGFSKAGLIEQLSSQAGEGYPKADAEWAVEHVEVDWNKEAVEAAKSYLEFSSFSRSGLIDQLSSAAGSQFTKAQATYAANKMGL